VADASVRAGTDKAFLERLTEFVEAAVESCLVGRASELQGCRGGGIRILSDTGNRNEPHFLAWKPDGSQE
jgi:hypothetical protein